MKKGQYYAARFHGQNGDLVVGRIESVRKNGDIILTNMLTGNRSVKKATVLSHRNHQVTKTEADQIASKPTHAAARLQAVKLYVAKSGDKKHRLKRTEKLRKRLDALVQESISLNAEMARVREQLKELS